MTIQTRIAQATGLQEPLTIVPRTSTNLVAWQVTDGRNQTQYFDRSSVHTTDTKDGWAEVLNQVTRS